MLWIAERATWLGIDWRAAWDDTYLRSLFEQEYMRETAIDRTRFERESQAFKLSTYEAGVMSTLTNNVIKALGGPQNATKATYNKVFAPKQKRKKAEEIAANFAEIQRRKRERRLANGAA